MSFDFWCRWLLLVSIMSVIVGLAIAFFPDSVLFAFHTSAIEQAFFDGSMPEEAAHLRAFLFGPLGGTIAGYFLMQTLFVWGPFWRRELWAWHAVLWPLLLWFAVDSGMSMYHGALFNVWMINVWTLLLVGVALAMTYRDFRGSGAAPRSSVASGQQRLS